MSEESAPRPVHSIRPGEVGLGSFSIVNGNAKQNRLWNEYVERYHYLGYGVALGAHIK